MPRSSGRLALHARERPPHTEGQDLEGERTRLNEARSASAARENAAAPIHNGDDADRRARRRGRRWPGADVDATKTAKRPEPRPGREHPRGGETRPAMVRPAEVPPWWDVTTAILLVTWPSRPFVVVFAPASRPRKVAGRVHGLVFCEPC